MRRILVVLVLIANVSAVLADDAPKDKPASAVPVTDTGVYRPWASPRIGEQGHIAWANTPACKDAKVFPRIAKAALARDDFGLKELTDKKLTVNLPRGTAVAVLSTTRKPAAATVQSTESYARQQVTLTVDENVYRVEVRVLNGERQGEIFFVPEQYLGRMVEGKPRAKRPAAEKAVNPESAAATLLASGRRLERAGNVRGAVAIYEDVAKRYAGTKAGRDAAGLVRSRVSD